jgi:hypothetical protein
MRFIPFYISEVIPKEYSTKFVTYPQLSVVVGMLVSYGLVIIITDCFDLENVNAVAQAWQL